VAKASFISSLTGGVPADLRLVFQRIAEYFFNNLRIGVPENAVRSENFQLYNFSATTPSTANTEFSIAHHLGNAPYLLLPCLNLSNVNEQLIPLQVSRAADASRIYLKSTSTSATFRIWVEVP
jgi:hypothetical protein